MSPLSQTNPVARIRALALLAALAVFQSCWADAENPAPATEEQDSARVEVRIALQWLPQSQFAGFYLAREQGFYAAAGADVHLLHANAQRSSLDLLEDGEAELATAFLTDAIVTAARTGTTAVRPVLIGQLVQRSNLMLLAWKNHGIERLTDLNGHRISLWSGAFATALRTLLAESGIEYESIPQSATVTLFLRGGVSACAAMEYNEYHSIWQAGVDKDRLSVFLLRDLGLNFPEDGLYARSDWLQAHAALARRLWQATLAGWEYARDHPEQALDLVLAEAESARILTNRPHERWMLEQILASIFPDRAQETSAENAPTGVRLSASTYAAIAQALSASELISDALPLVQFCPDCQTEEAANAPR